MGAKLLSNRKSLLQAIELRTDRHCKFLWAAPLLLLALGQGAVRADGGTLRLTETKNGYQISIFTAPNPVRVGPVDVSVFVQEATTGEVLTNANVEVIWRKAGIWNLQAAATREAATNKLLRAVQLEIPEAGRWTVFVQVEGEHGTAQVECELDVAEPLPRWRALWPWFAWPALPILLFCFQKALPKRSPMNSAREST